MAEGVQVDVNVGVAVNVRVEVGFWVEVEDDVGVTVKVAEAVYVGLGVNDGSRQSGIESLKPSGSRVVPD